MLALEMLLLTGRYAATAYNDRGAAEWPPHPARLFSALVATHHAEVNPPRVERDALEWLEAQGAPSICASEACVRDVVTVFVPVNDTTVIGDFENEGHAIEDAVSKLGAVQAELAVARERGNGLKDLEKKAAKAQKALDKARAALVNKVAKATVLKGTGSRSECHLAEGQFPERRNRQPRTFPSVTPFDPVVVFVWPDAAPNTDVRAALGRLCERVVRVGHSSSLVRLRLVDEPPRAAWQPDETGSRRFRVPLAGQLDRLEAEFERHQETEPRVLPSLAQGYSRRRTQDDLSAPTSVFDDDWPILRFVGEKGRALPILATAALAEAVRAVLQRYSEEPIPEILSGHRPDGSPSQSAHLALVPLPSVAGPHADGHLLGVALVFPRDAEREQRAAVFRALAAWEAACREPESEEDCPELTLVVGGTGAYRLQRVEDIPTLVNLRSETWCRSGLGERVWMSATPVALDRNPGELRSREPGKASRAFAEAESVLADACERVGLPRPDGVWVTRSAPLSGAAKVQRYPRFPSNIAKPQRVLVHAMLRFPKPVVGPVLLGAGRYRGLGLLRPVAVDLVAGSEFQMALAVE